MNALTSGGKVSYPALSLTFTMLWPGFVANVAFCWQFLACNRRIPKLVQQQFGCDGSSE